MGGIIRSAVAFGVRDIYTCGITPYPMQKNDSRLPHVARAATQAINKTALTGVDDCNFTHFPHASAAIAHCQDTHHIYAIELDKSAKNLADTTLQQPAALVLGSEVNGISPDALELADAVLYIPTTKDKQSLNVTTACGIALYQLFTHS